MSTNSTPPPPGQPINLTPPSMNFKQYLAYMVATAVIGIGTSYFTTKGTAEPAVHHAVSADSTKEQIRNQITSSIGNQQFGPIVGEIRSFAFGGERDAPAIRKLRVADWLECAGQDLAIHDYPELYAAVQEAWGSSSPGNNFYVPDLRGRFLRAWNNGANTDADAGSRLPTKVNGIPGNFVGSSQPDAIQAHSHTIKDYRPGSLKSIEGNGIYALLGMGDSTTLGAIGASVASETRPKNVYVMYCIFVGRSVSEATPDGSRP